LTASTKIETTQILIQGLIQGIGFRPFIFRLANQHHLHGNVYNQTNGVVINLQGKPAQIDKFIEAITIQAPEASRIESIKRKNTRIEKYTSFVIQKSKKNNKSITQISPDISVCSDCITDLKHHPRLFNYPFTNCTNCGPRFSIIENIPYDRALTSMKQFQMCPECNAEYDDITNRRFHAQPLACNNCGPGYCLHFKEGVHTSFSEILVLLNDILKSGGTVAIKGLGGFHLACDALNEGAIKKLRSIKVRDGKPFALMASSLEVARKYARINKEEEQALISWRRPIVLLESKYKLSDEIAGDLNTLGIFLPYLPFHYELFDAIDTNVLVMTSGNISDCPIIIDNDLALETFNTKTDAILTHNRRIVNRVDDSVVQRIGQHIHTLRRSRAYTPTPIELSLKTEGIFASGAELSNAFCIGKGKQAILSQHIGDLKNLETMEFFEQSFESFQRLFEFEPKQVVCDMHPEYLSTKFAQKLGLPLIETQHHHAHIAACMAEYGLDEPVIGVCYDGTGFGTDGKIWGSEIMLANLSDFDRKYHFEYVPIPGGDKASAEPWRSALAYLYLSFEKEIPEGLSFFEKIDPQQLKLVLLALEKKINTPESCSTGRLFDAVASLLNICTHASYHAEAPILLENLVQKNIKEYYPVGLRPEISWKETIQAIVNDLKNQVPLSIISTKFHNSIINISFEAIKKIHLETGINKVVLAGGSFQNIYISEKLLNLLYQTGIKSYISNQIPVNDGGISLGQLAIAAKKLSLCV
jgi:hydrogenase maturation protein HypF